MMSPLPVADKPLNLSVQLTELTGVVYDTARTGLPAHGLERGLWPRLLQLGHDLEAANFALAGDRDGGATVTLGDERVVKRLPLPGDPLFVSIAEEIRQRTLAPAIGFPVHKAWDSRTPTTSVWLDECTSLPRNATATLGVRASAPAVPIAVE